MRHLIFPASFFPSIGGAQGSLINFLHCFNESDQVHLAVGLRGFFFSLLKKRKARLSLPYVSNLISKKFSLRIYLTILEKVWKPDVIWLYGGGLLAARILENRDIFSSKVKIVLRSMGSDIQYDERSDYGFDRQSDEFEYILNQYKKADFLWALSEEIEKLYRKNLVKFSGKIIRCGNSIWRPNKKIEQPRSNKINIGLIGRNHPKKNFQLLDEIVQKLDDKKYDIFLKTPGFKLKSDRSNVHYESKTKVNDLIYWPPSDVWDFYNKIDVLLILSRIESFGNVTFEAGLSGCVIVMNQNTTGATLARDYDLDIVTFDQFNTKNIIDAIESVKFNKQLVLKPSLNSDQLKALIAEICNG